MVNFHSVLSSDASIHFTADNDGAGLDLAMDACALADDQSVRRINFSAKRATDADRSLEAELAFKLTAVIDHPCYSRIGSGDAEVVWTAHRGISLRIMRGAT